VRRLLIVQPGQKLPELERVPGEFADWVSTGMGLAPGQWKVRYPQRGDELPADPAAAVLTGSGAMVTDDTPWIRGLSDWLRARVDEGVPVLGICFGHQLLATALGGEVRDNPRGIEVGTVESIRSGRDDPLLGALPGRFLVQASHRQSVIRLPPGAVHLAESARDPNHAFRVGDSAWGVQFHPEFDDCIVPEYVAYYKDDLKEQGVEIKNLLSDVRATPAGPQLLKRFARHIRKRLCAAN